MNGAYAPQRRCRASSGGSRFGHRGGNKKGDPPQSGGIKEAIIEFDTELSINGIFGFLENSIGHYSPNIIEAFRTIGDDNDADTLEEICHLAPPNSIRAEFISNISQEYEITSFHDNHEMAEKVDEHIAQL